MYVESKIIIIIDKINNKQNKITNKKRTLIVLSGFFSFLDRGAFYQKSFIPASVFYTLLLAFPLHWLSKCCFGYVGYHEEHNAPATADSPWSTNTEDD
ncbi:hypothetical protein SODALDRAFT_106194 [Sodiomyces alkalinus F11]|uniref:Uncharacterized protein n=1 Tax=Sodiomyces alkalinus (strain CBS 110278 / VKM F-3762 / F11) TaxID=1314773 RepID=A0A3N2Q2F8_SODAK|nr:hypothetical protein SODALDRAFT_106194 [Sodiomyces alkalinus F11]ROT40858.1 hypothetical protein SODALDRAFT_106194 [Sodiomyces alkalinus F11]